MFVGVFDADRLQITHCEKRREPSSLNCCFAECRTRTHSCPSKVSWSLFIRDDEDRLPSSLLDLLLDELDNKVESVLEGIDVRLGKEMLKLTIDQIGIRDEEATALEHRLSRNDGAKEVAIIMVELIDDEWRVPGPRMIDQDHTLIDSRDEVVIEIAIAIVDEVVEQLDAAAKEGSERHAMPRTCRFASACEYQAHSYRVQRRHLG